MRLIDADALEKEGWSLHRTIRVDKNTSEYQTMPLANVPDIYTGECDDAVNRSDLLRTARQEIIHCRECRYYYFADNRCYGESDDIRWPPDGFCSFAERREDE